jgi:uncharacterized protein YuzE
LRLQHDRERNALRLLLDDDSRQAVTRLTVAGVVDVAANGRLVGIEVQTGIDETSLADALAAWLGDPVAGEFISQEGNGGLYIELTTGDPDEHTRSSEVSIDLELDTGRELVGISIPRRGAGYEISYPSGNR